MSKAVSVGFVFLRANRVEGVPFQAINTVKPHIFLFLDPVQLFEKL